MLVRGEIGANYKIFLGWLGDLSSVLAAALADARFALRTSSTVRSSAPAALHSITEDKSNSGLLEFLFFGYLAIWCVL